MKTSLTHPLQIATVSRGKEIGRVGITFCPGKFDPTAKSGFWNRNLSLDLEAIYKWGATAIVTLLEEEELALLGVTNLGEEVARKNMIWFHLPIRDVSIPDDEFEKKWQFSGNELRALLLCGRDVLIHCRGGLGRAGTVGARLLVETGMEPKTAMSRIRLARPGAIETCEQEKYVLNIDTVT